MPVAPPSPGAPPSQGGPVETSPLDCGGLVLLPDQRNQRAELGEALLYVSDLMEAADIAPSPWVRPSATMCLHCNQRPATKAEHDDGFTLCDACYFQALPDVPPRTAQDRLIAVQTAEILRLTRELAAARNALVGGS